MLLCDVNKASVKFSVKIDLSGFQHFVWVDVLEMMKERMKEFENLLLLQEILR